jgi:hypothetical protein
MEPQTNELKSIRILFFALLAGQLVFALLITVLVESGLLSSGINNITIVLQVAVMAMALTTVPASYKKSKTLNSPGIDPNRDFK